MSRNYITFDNTDLRDFGLYISGSNVFNAPERAYNEITIPGRNGTLLGSEKRLENIPVVYPAFIYTNFKVNCAGLRSFLLSKVGYKKLIDTYHPTEYRMGYYAGGLDAEMTSKLDAGQFDLTFNCKPQRYLISGDTPVTLTASGTINNPTLFDSQPLIRVYGTGDITVNGVTITISEADGYTDIDCEIMECYKGNALKNYAVSLDSVDFPVLSPGDNTIGFDGVTSAVITPRWWTL